MRNGELTPDEGRKLVYLFKTIILALESGDFDAIDLDMVDVSPKQICDTLQRLGYKSIGFEYAENNAQYLYFSKPDHTDLILFYDGFEGNLWLDIAN